MKYLEIHDNLFNYSNKGYHLVHCISADFALGAGIAKEFEKRYHLREELIDALGNDWYSKEIESIGGVFYHKDKKILDLITKRRYFQKPTMASMRTALINMKSICKEFGINKLAMPKIGCGLDKLNWNDVSSAIKEIFADMQQMEIVVCYL